MIINILRQKDNIMSQSIHFTKMQGAGNDYIYVNTILYTIPNPESEAIKWSSYHTGIGSDGLILIGKPDEKTGADFSMRIFNADGSEAMMCGNGSRCVGKYLYEKGLTKKTSIRLLTKSGIKVLLLHLSKKESGIVDSVTVDMGEPQTEVPEQFTKNQPKLEDDLCENHGIFVSMGNPHYVIFVKDISKLDITRYGSRLERDAAFPQRCNIEFAQKTGPGQFRTRVWERGSGITQACGTGACATAVAAALSSGDMRENDIIMDGGTLRITWNRENNHVYLTGPAEFVFEGDINL